MAGRAREGGLERAREGGAGEDRCAVQRDDGRDASLASRDE